MSALHACTAPLLGSPTLDESHPKNAPRQIPSKFRTSFTSEVGQLQERLSSRFLEDPISKSMAFTVLNVRFFYIHRSSRCRTKHQVPSSVRLNLKSRARAAMRRPGGPAKRARRHGTMCPSPHQGRTDRGCTLLPSPDLVPVQKRLRTFSAQFHDFRPVRAQITTAR
jgi:hypothetical protein